MKMLFNKDICHDLTNAIEKEWLATNGIGGYASSTIIGANTRRYHGLLIADGPHTLGRTLLLSKLEEFLYIEGREFPLSTNIYPNAIYPEGYKHLLQFSLNPFPTFNYLINGMSIEKLVFMVHGENTTVVLYRINRNIESPSTTLISLNIRFMVAFRDYHWLTHQNSTFNTNHKMLDNNICLQPYEELPAMYVYHNAESVEKAQFWYKNMEYPREIERGLEAHEDLFCPFTLSFDLNKETNCYIVASTHEYNKIDVFELFRKETERRRRYPYVVQHNSNQSQNKERLEYGRDNNYEKGRAYDDTKQLPNSEKITRLIESLLSVSDTFIVRRGNDRKSIIAGYHWFGDWGRDTMISLPGITLVQGRFEEAKEILLSYARYVDKGMIPNRFPDYGEIPEYNTVDASLWFINAVYQYLRFAKDLKSIKNNLYGTLKEIVAYYKKGTRFNIHMDTDGLIYAGAEGVQLTWMDAKLCDWVVTPRMGKAVEVNALWYNALKILSYLAREMNFKEDCNNYNTLANKVKESFNKSFWFEEGHYLYDYINNELKDAAIRPNQIFAVSLPYPVLLMERWRNVTNVVSKHLLTPYGLRTLSPEDKNYIGCYCGNVYERDKAYHQGTVWTWLIGPYISGYVRAHAGTKNTIEYAMGLLEPFYAHLFESGLGTISEIFDGNAPHKPRGCISQAWSVAEILRVYFEYIYGFEDNDIR